MSFIAKGLQVFGALALASVIAVFGYITYSFVSDSDHTNTATKDNVQFVFNWGGLNAKQDYKLLSSFESRRSLNGDHLDHYCIQIADFTPSANEKENWAPISALGSAAQEAVSQAQDSGNAPQCFGRKLGKSPELQTYIWSVTLHGRRVTAYDIILFDAQTKRLLYVSDKT
jgi:hypothetical protein